MSCMAIIMNHLVLDFSHFHWHYLYIQRTRIFLVSSYWSYMDSSLSNWICNTLQGWRILNDCHFIFFLIEVGFVSSGGRFLNGFVYLTKLTGWLHAPFPFLRVSFKQQPEGWYFASVKFNNSVSSERQCPDYLNRPHSGHIFYCW